jgi:hypothetical protein
MTYRITLLLILIALGVVGTFDYEDALLEEAAYCDRLKNKVHTDYNNLKSTCIARHWNT